MKNKKGFMLAEIIIVSTIVMIGLVSLFTLVNKMFIQYDKRIAYDTVDATYVSRGLAENYTEDIIKREFKNDDDIYRQYDLESNLNYDKTIEYLKKNNVIHSFIVRYDSDKIKTFVEEVYNDPEKKINDEYQIGKNFYDYVNNYVDSNDFSDSSTYKFIIFTAISDNCEEDGNKKICIEDNGNISFGYYKFNYEIKNISTTENSELPLIYNVKLEPYEREYGLDYDKLYNYKISWETKNITKDHIILVNIYSDLGELQNSTPIEIDYNISSITQEDTKFKNPGKYYVEVFAKKGNNSSKNSCSLVFSNYCGKSEIVTIGKLKYTTTFTNSTFNMNTADSDIYAKSTINFDVGTESENGYTFAFGSWSVKNSDSDTNLAGNADSGTKIVTLEDKDFMITVNSTKTKEVTSSGDTGCLAEGTKILLANGNYKNIEDIDYNDLLAVFDHETGKLTYQYSGWLEKPGIASNYTKVTFSDGTSINFTNNHAIYSLDYNEYITIYDKEKFKIGSKVAKYKNNKVEETIVTNIENIDKEVKYYHILSNRHFNVIANDLITVNKEIFVSNFHGFENDLTWKMPILKENIYSYEELSEIPYYLYKGLRLYEGKFFISYGMDKNAYLGFLKDFILNENKTLKPELNQNGKREWMVTTSDDVVTEKNKLSYLMEEGDYYTLKEPIKKDNKKFIGWLHTGENIIYQPGDKVEVLYGTHFIAKWDDLFNKYNGSDYFEKNE